MTGKFHLKACLIITDASIKKFPKAEPKEKEGRRNEKNRKRKRKRFSLLEMFLLPQKVYSHARKKGNIFSELNKKL